MKNKVNKKGFTLIELLAVIIILGVLLLIAVPAVSRYIDESRKDTYASSVKSIIGAVSTSLNNMEYPFNLGKNEGIIVPFSEANLEKSGAKTKSPYGPYIADKSYVLAYFDGDNFHYYAVALDETGFGIPMIDDKALDSSSITDDDKMIDNNIISMNDIIGSTNVIETDSIVIKYKEHSGNIIKVDICMIPYEDGDIVQLKDGSKWYVTKDSDENNEMLSLVSYNHMDTNPSNYGLQSNSKVSPTIRFHRDQSIIEYNSSADIYSVSQSIIAATRVKLTEAGLAMGNTTIRMPRAEDFNCSIDTNQCTGVGHQVTYLSNGGDGRFWTSDSVPGWVITISPGIGRATPENYYGIRIILETLKVNVDREATKALN